MSLRLYVKIKGKYIELSALAIGDAIRPIIILPLFVAVGIYLRDCTSKKSKHTRTNEKRYFSDLNEFLISKDVYLCHEITPLLIIEYRNQMLKRVSPATVNRQFNTLKNFFNALTKDNICHINPCIKIKQEKTKRPKVHLWTNEDLALVKQGLDPDMRFILEFMRLTGARNIEAVDLTWADVDQDVGTITLRSRKSSDHFRLFPINDALSQLLHLVNFKGLYVFGGGNKFTSDSLGKKLKKAVHKHCINKELTAYSLRHTFCKDMLAAGLSRPQIQALMGHEDWRTTESYSHWDVKTLRLALDKIRKI